MKLKYKLLSNIISYLYVHSVSSTMNANSPSSCCFLSSLRYDFIHMKYHIQYYQFLYLTSIMIKISFHSFSNLSMYKFHWFSILNSFLNQLDITSSNTLFLFIPPSILLFTSSQTLSNSVFSYIFNTLQYKYLLLKIYKSLHCFISFIFSLLFLTSTYITQLFKLILCLLFILLALCTH
jgi:hypothetical protein